MRKFICFTISFLLIFSTHYMAFEALTIEETEKKIYSNATTEDNFSDDSLMVVLKNDLSLKSKAYTTRDFSEIECSSVESITKPIEDKFETKKNSFGVMKTTNNFHQVLCINLKKSGKENVLSAIKVLERREDVLYVGPDYYMTYYDDYTSYTDYKEQWSFGKIQLPQAWEIVLNGHAVKVGIIDSGIDASHPNLASKIYAPLCRDFSTGNEEFILSPTDYNGHGTNVAGIIGAQLNDSSGVQGVCDNVQLVSLKVGGAGGAKASNAAKAIIFAEENNIPILNISMGWDMGDTKYDCALEQVIACYSGLIICAAGNSQRDIDGFVACVYPAEFSNSNILTVGASSEMDSILTLPNNRGSNYGRNSVDLFSPGEKIWATKKGGGFEMVGQTSMATPIVTGVAALMLSYNPCLTTAQIKQLIMNNVDVIYDANGNNVFENLCVSGGRLNAFKAIQAAIHVHDDYLDISEDWHTYNCSTCEESGIEQPHDFIPQPCSVQTSDYSHYLVCHCGYRSYGFCSYDIKISYTDAKHVNYCLCGSYYISNHVFIASPEGSDYNWICRDCGKTNDDTTMPTPQSLVSGTVMMQMNTSGVITLPDGTTLRILTETGSYVLSNGIIVLSPEDAALVEAGLLDPYELVENITVPSGPDLVTE